MTLYELLELNERLRRQEITLEDWKLLVLDADFWQGRPPGVQRKKQPADAPRQTDIGDRLSSSEVISPAE